MLQPRMSRGVGHLAAIRILGGRGLLQAARFQHQHSQAGPAQGVRHCQARGAAADNANVGLAGLGLKISPVNDHLGSRRMAHDGRDR